MPFSNNIIATELDNIKNNAFSVRGYFHILLTQLLGSTLPNAHSALQVHDEMITEHNLPSVLETKFINTNYLVLFYAHRPNLLDKSPFFPEQETAHTSILLCKIDSKFNPMAGMWDCGSGYRRHGACTLGVTFWNHWS